MGVLTGCFGGIVRDVLAGEPSILMRPELYVTAAALSAALLVGLRSPACRRRRRAIAAAAGFALRGGADLSAAGRSRAAETARDGFPT